MLVHARQHAGTLGGDVNEHSPRAVSFYLANGFVIHSRSETDGQGNPFPLLHLIESRTVV